jgi:hypothetical protein
MASSYSFLSFRVTATTDSPFNVIDDDAVWLKYADIIFQTNDGVVCDQYGNSIATIRRSDNSNTYIFEIPHPVRVSDLYAKNSNAGQNMIFIVSGTLLTDKEKQEGGYV